MAGFIGVVGLPLATYGLGILPVNWFGIVFLVLAFVLFILDIKAPTHGALTAAGVASFIIGGAGAVQLAQRALFPARLGAAGGRHRAGHGGDVLRRRLVCPARPAAPVRTGARPLIGRVGVARSPLGPDGTVQVGGELWSARLAEGEPPLPREAAVEILGMDGIRLRVKPASRDAGGSSRSTRLCLNSLKKQVSFFYAITEDGMLNRIMGVFQA